jgi:hypothetical protein
VGAGLAAAGSGLLAANAFPVPGKVVLLPTIGVVCLVAGAVLLRVHPIGRRQPA